MIDKVKEIALKVWPFLLVLLVGVAVGWQVKPTKVEEKTKIVEVEKQIVVEKEVLIEKKPVLPDWHMGLLVGASLRTPVSDTPLMVGIEVERRLLGPFFLGAWGMAGSPVVGGFNVTNVTFGIKLGAEF